MNSLKTRFQQIKEELIKGGMGDGKTLRDIAKKHNVELSTIEDQFKMGEKVEMEHTTDVRIAKEIARDHLTEKKFWARLNLMVKKKESK